MCRLRRRTPVPALLLVTSLTACGDLGFESAVQDKEAWDPPESHAEWYGTTEACSGLTGQYGRVSWFLASGITGDGAVARGRWSPPHDIVIVRGYETDEKTVRHEILHDLLTGDPNHDDPSWVACDLLFG